METSFWWIFLWWVYNLLFLSLLVSFYLKSIWSYVKMLWANTCLLWDYLFGIPFFISLPEVMPILMIMCVSWMQQMDESWFWKLSVSLWLLIGELWQLMLIIINEQCLPISLMPVLWWGSHSLNLLVWIYVLLCFLGCG